MNAELLVEVSGDEFAGDNVGVTIDGSGEALGSEILKGEEVFEHRFGEVLLTHELIDGVREGVG